MRTMLSPFAISVGLAVALVSASAARADENRLGFSSADVTRYKQVGANIPSCNEAQHLDKYDLQCVAPSPHLAGLYGLCHYALKKRSVPIQLIRVNDSLLGIQCIAIGGTGGDLPDACNIPSSIPAGQ